MTDELRPNIFPALIYRDADAALDFLKRAFGAEEKAVYRDDDGRIYHGELRFGAGLIMFGEYAPDRWIGEEPRPLASPTGLYIVVPDPDDHHARASAAGAEIIRTLVDQPYGSREYSARDLEGNRWSFGTYDPYAG